MIFSNYPFTLDIHNTLSQVSIPVTLGDTARQLFISLTDGGKPYIIADGCRATLAGKKADGTSILHDCIIEKNTTIHYDFTEQTATAIGKTDCQILLYDEDGRLIASPRFTMVVYKDVLGVDVLSEDELLSIGRMLAAEEVRVVEENERVAAENERVESESGRVEAENERVEAEKERYAALREALSAVEHSGVYVGEGEMPNGYFLQVCPLGDAQGELGKTWLLSINDDGNIDLVSLEEAVAGATNNVVSDAIKGTITQKTGDSETMVMSQKTTTDYLMQHSKRLANLEQGLVPSPFVTDDSAAYVKDVPLNALPYAEVSIVGGVTRNCTNEFNPSYIKRLDNLTYSDGVFKQIAADTRVVQYFKMQKFKNDGYVGEACSSYAGYVGVLKSSFTIDGTFDTLRIGFGGESMDTIFDMDVTNLANGAYYISINCTNLTQGSVSFTEVMISTKDIPYEPYFEGVRSAPVTEVESMGANLMPLLTEKTQYGITIRRDSDGIYHISGTATANVAEVIPISLPEGTYSLRLNCSRSVGTKADDTICVVARSSNSWAISRHAYEDDVALTKSCPKIDSILFVVYKGVTCDDVTIAPMLNKGAALPYSPYNKQSLPIPEAVQALEGYGWGISDTCYNYIDFENKRFVKRVEKVVLDGSADEKWYATPGLNATDYNAYYVRLYAENSHKTAYGVAVGDTLLNRTVADLHNKNCDGFWMGDKTDKQIVVRVPNTITNATELRTWLSANPLTVYYEAMETTVIDVSDILSNDNYIEVEGGGTLTFKNENKTDVPSEVTYQIKEAIE